MGATYSSPPNSDGDEATFVRETATKIAKSSETKSRGEASAKPEPSTAPGIQKMAPAHEVNNPEFEINTSKMNNGANNGGGKPILSPRSSHIADNDVHVNLAMADLMAYLQVVADNSHNLPLTRRDDPELGRSVSTLSAEDYAKKSAAFIPSDVRVIGGSFTRYGRVWDLPTCEEFNVMDGVQEPGRSYGGACSNALLKVLYDLASEAEDDVIQKTMTPGSLFEDDEESLMPGPMGIDRTKTFESLVIGDAPTPSNITWASLLRKMKVEMEEIEYAQVPTVSSTRKIDLNAPFSLVPSNFDPEKGKKRSLLIGCNYTDTLGAELTASLDDVRSMKDYIVNVHGFPESKGLMTVLLDDNDHRHPTHLNITEAFKALSEQSQPGDTVFIMFSGHGGRIFDAPITEEVESYDETIVPSDFEDSGLVRDTLIFKTLLAPMRAGVTVTMIIDCCDTGMMLDLPYSWTTKNDRVDSHARMSLNDDFSFVRFLKVVKTLYESSVFTQLGKTVGSVLEYQPVSSRDDTEVEGTTTCDEYTVDDDNSVAEDQTLKEVPDTSSMLCFALQKSKNGCDVASDSMRSGHAQLARERTGSQSLFEQVMNCTLGHEEELSDDDTFPVSSYDEGEASTFDTELDSLPRARVRKPIRRAV